MTAKHTPGPWSYTGEVESVGITDVSLWLWIGSVFPHTAGSLYRGCICKIQSCDHIDGISQKEAHANARLIAASPELLAACREALPYFEDDQGISGVLASAIAKAEGRS